MHYFDPLEYDNFYHIYNHANGFENLFTNRNSYSSFLTRLNQYLLPVLDIYCYNLLMNHFHLLVKIKTEDKIIKNSIDWARQNKKSFKLLDASKQFSNCFNSYAKSYNKLHSRTGSLFQERFRRIKILNENKLLDMVGYIHTNAQHHNLVKHFSDWEYSSYHDAVSDGNTFIERNKLLNLFGGKKQFIQFHTEYSNSILENRYWLE